VNGTGRPGRRVGRSDGSTTATRSSLQLTPFPRPVTGGALRQDGIYGLVRHPMYGGALLLILGWALLSSPFVLLPLGLAAVFLEAKSRREEAWLVDEHPDYPQYRLKVSRRFVPWVW